MTTIVLNNDPTYREVTIDNSYPHVTIIKRRHTGGSEARQVHIPEFKRGVNLSLSELDEWALGQAGYRVDE